MNPNRLSPITKMAAELSLFVGESDIRCPLCMKVFSEDEMSIEHVIPKKAGGRKCICTCRQCNNFYGKEIDIDFVNFRRLNAAFKGVGTIRGTINATTPIPVNIEWKEKTKNIKIVPNSYLPSSEVEFRKKMSGNEIPSINMTLNFGYRNLQLRRSIIKSAYLSIIHSYGASCICNEAFDWVRNAIQGKISNELLELVVLFTDKMVFTPKLSAEYLILELNGDLGSFNYVFLGDSKGNHDHVLVLMPSHINPSLAFLDVAKAMREEVNANQGKLSFKMKIPPAEMLAE